MRQLSYFEAPTIPPSLQSSGFDSRISKSSVIKKKERKKETKRKRTNKNSQTHGNKFGVS